jgi:hypothetical protein
MAGKKVLKNAWRLDVLYIKYERLKKIQEEEQQKQ